MAKAALKEETIVKVVGVTLELTYIEAQYLRALLYRHVGGAGPMRKALTDDIGSALEDAGVEPAPKDSYDVERGALIAFEGGDL